MNTIYRVTIHGVTFESGDLKQLLSRAVIEKRDMDQKARRFWHLQKSSLTSYTEISVGKALLAGGTQ